MITSLTASGTSLLASADRLLTRSAATFAHSALPTPRDSAPDTAAADRGLEPLTSAAIDLLDGRASFRIGVALIATGRDLDQHLLDVIA
jgi:hypothetical protein